MQTLSEFRNLADCQRAIDLSRNMVAEWLRKYMGLSESNATNIADHLADASRHKAHDRRLNFEQLQTLGLNVKPLESEQKLQEAVLSVFHATTITFEGTSCVKLVENHLGKGVYQYARPE